MLKDFRFGARMLLKQPVFTIVAVLTLALGIGATSAVFSLIEGVLLSPPPYREPEQTRAGRLRAHGQSTMESPQRLGSAAVDELAEGSEVVESVAAYGWTFNFLVLDDGSESLQGMPVTKDYFQVLGLQPILGRAFSESEGRPGSAPVIIIGYELWQRKFNGDPNIIGKPMRMSRVQTPPTIIGVMPPGVRFLPTPMASKEPNYNVNARVQYWVPAVPNPERLKSPGWNVVARLRPDASLEQAQTELSVLTDRVAGEAPELAGVAPRLRFPFSGNESGWQSNPVTVAWRRGAGAADCVRQCRRAAPGARSATATGVRSAECDGQYAASSFSGRFRQKISCSLS